MGFALVHGLFSIDEENEALSNDKENQQLDVFEDTHDEICQCKPHDS